MEIGHVTREGWGLYPQLQFGHLHVSAYAFFLLLAFLAGFFLYRYNVSRSGIDRGRVFPVVVAAVFGGTLGAKLPIWCLALIHIPLREWDLDVFLSGRTILGGFIGGMCSVWWIKRHLHIRDRFGNILVPSIALGLAIGRIGCLLAGCCYGKETALPWGLNFGDGVSRHPTQIYDMLFCLAAFAVIQPRAHSAPPGRLMTRFFVAYFLFRFFEELWRAEAPCMGLTVFQWICLGGLLLIGTREYILRRVASLKGEHGVEECTNAR